MFFFSKVLWFRWVVISVCLCVTICIMLSSKVVMWAHLRFLGIAFCLLPLPLWMLQCHLHVFLSISNAVVFSLSSRLDLRLSLEGQKDFIWGQRTMPHVDFNVPLWFHDAMFMLLNCQDEAVDSCLADATFGVLWSSSSAQWRSSRGHTVSTCRRGYGVYEQRL